LLEGYGVGVVGTPAVFGVVVRLAALPTVMTGVACGVGVVFRAVVGDPVLAATGVAVPAGTVEVPVRPGVAVNALASVGSGFGVLIEATSADPGVT
jgi:hypothetical protein